jgi:carboxypeptidase Taq
LIHTNQNQETVYQQLEQNSAAFTPSAPFRSAVDVAVMMARGAEARRAIRRSNRVHALLTAPKIIRLLDRAQANAQGLEDWHVANLREMRRQRDHAIATPQALISRLARVTARAEVKWLEARQQNNFELFAPHLEEVVALVRDKATLLGQALNLQPYDALVDEYSPGITTQDIDTMFKALSRKLPGLINDVIELQSRQTLLPLAGKFTPARQRQLVVDVMRALGFPFDRGRLDESDHPFTEGVPGDIRITTRFDQSDPFMGLLGVLHESGHAMYDLGLPQAWRDQPVGRDRGMALEESQSLLLEMIIGRSRAFVRYIKPLLEKNFGVTGPEWEVENLYRHLNRVRSADPRRCRRAELSAAHHASLRSRASHPCRRTGDPEHSRSVERLHGRAARRAPGQRRRGLPSGHSLGGRLIRLFPIPPWERSSRRSSGTRCAASCLSSKTRSRRVNSRGCSGGCRRMSTGSAPRCRSRS